MSTFTPMQAQAVSVEEVPKKCKGYVIEPKLDGWRCIVVRDETGVKMYSRTGKEMQDKVTPMLYEECYDLPVGTVLDGELGFVTMKSGREFWPIFDYNLTARVLGSSPSTAQDKIWELGADAASMEFIPFDILQYANLDCRVLTLDNRSEILCKQQSLENIQFRGVIDYGYQIDGPEGNGEGWQAVYDKYVLRGGEGLMLKNLNSTYQSGKRPTKTWYKLKKFETDDVVIMSFDPGQGKYTGQIGAIVFGKFVNGQALNTPGVLVEVGKCSGMDDTTRSLMSQSQDWYKGRVIEIKHYGAVGKDRTGLRHPQFLRMRFDKDPQECIL